MKLCNKKGFILVETLVVTAFVMTLFIFVYQNLVPFLGEYEKMITYDDIDSIYAANQIKKVIVLDGNLEYIDNSLTSNYYVNISNCDDINIYKDSKYCKKMKGILNITDNDYIFITEYNLNKFRSEVKNDEFFDSGKLSNFRGYINTIPDVDQFYTTDNPNNRLDGKYRLFITRTVTNSDLSTTLKYANIGVFNIKDLEYAIYNNSYSVGSTVTWAGYTWKVIKDNDSSVNLILAENYGTGIYGNTTDFENSTAKTVVNTNFMNSNDVLKEAVSEGSIKYNNETQSYRRLPYLDELSNNISSNSNTPFLTMSSTDNNLYLGSSDGTKANNYIAKTTANYYSGYSASLASIQKTGTKCRNCYS